MTEGGGRELERLHQEVALRLARLDQRYTEGRRELVTVLAAAGRPLSLAEILAERTALAMSSAYRNLTVLTEAAVVRRLAGPDDLGRFELHEDLSGHHHHLVCGSCGRVDDVPSSPRLERALAEAARAVADEMGYAVSEHRIELVGACPACM